MNVERRFLLGGVVCAPVLAGIGACASLGAPGIVFSQRELQALLERRFPIDRRLLEVFDVQLRGPRVSLLPERNRLALELALGTRDRLRGQAFDGRLAFDAELRWNDAARSLQLSQVRVSDFTLDGAARSERSGFERLGGALLERVLEEMVVYTLPTERAEALSARGLAPGAVKVTSRGVEVTFERIIR